MKLLLHSYQLGDRGTEICLYKYAKYNRDILGNESIIVSTSSRPMPSANRFKEFSTFVYPNVWRSDKQNQQLREDLMRLCDREKVGAFYAIKGGENDEFMPTNVKTLAHCVFQLHEPHGDVYAGVCKYLSDKYGGIHPYVFHIIEKEAPNNFEDYREELGIPKDALVLGRHGGSDTFSLEFVKNVIRNILPQRSDLYFVFLNTNKFVEHERVKYLPWTMSEDEKAKFVNTCDGMIHARFDGEIFSLSTAEFSVRNKPINTWKPDNVPGHYDTGHIWVLKNNGIYYRDGNELQNILLNISKKDINDRNWDVYGDTYSPINVMNQFNDVFLK